MTVAIDGFELMKAIGSNREVFADARAAVSKSALTIVVGQFKAKGVTLSKLQALQGALGASTFALLLESLDDKAVTGLLNKIDKHHPDRTTGSPTWKRSHLCDLASRAADPSNPPPPKPKGGSKAKAGGGRKPKAASPAENTFWPQSMQVSPRRKPKETQ